MMLHLTIKYFIQFGQLDIPRIGQLRLIKKEAFFNEGLLISPSEHIEFELGQVMPSKQFYQYLANALDISADQASMQYEKLWSHQIENEHQIAIGSLGVLTKKQDTYTWESHYFSKNYFNDIEVSDSIKSNFQEDTVIEIQKDHWWIWAIVFCCIAILGILCKQ